MSRNQLYVIWLLNNEAARAEGVLEEYGENEHWIDESIYSIYYKSDQNQ